MNATVVSAAGGVLASAVAAAISRRGLAALLATAIAGTRHAILTDARLANPVTAESGRLGEAVDLLEAAITRYDRVRAMTPIWSVKAHYLLGRAYEGSGWDPKAIEQYETFLEIWKDADPGIPVLEDARERLTRLRDR